MYRLRKNRARFSQISTYSLGYYNFTDSNSARKFILATGILNHLWQSWNHFWRAYWLAHITGGYDLRNKKIFPLCCGMSEPKALYYLLTLIGKKKAGTVGTVNSSHQEATWGDIKIIQDLAVRLATQTNNVSNVSTAASLFGLTVKHIQEVRNAQIHISMSNMVKLSSDVVPYYVISKPKYPHDIIEAKEISSGKIAINSWIENMNGFLNYL
jgi:hypothetical protein